MKHRAAGQAPRFGKNEPDIDFRVVVAHTSDAVTVADRQGRIKYINPATERMFGYSIEDLKTVQNTIALLFPDAEARERVVGSWRKDMDGGANAPHVFSGRTKEGRQIWTRTHLFHLPNGDAVTIMQDVSSIGLVEGHFRAIIENAPISTAIVGMDGRIEYFNRKAFVTFGYSPEEIPTMDQWWFRAYPDRKYREEVKTTWQGLVEEAIRESREIEASEYRVTCKDGTVKVMLIFGVPVAGKVFVMFQDITARKEAQETFRNLAEQSPSMIFINAFGRVVFANRKCEETMGYTREEICSPAFNFMNLVAPECHALTAKAFKQHMAGKDTPSYEYTIVTKDKRRIPAVISTKLILYEGKRAILGVVTDVSALKQAERELSSAAAKLREQKKALEEKNAALKEVLAQIETEKLETKQQISANAGKFLIPIVERMRQKAAPSERKQCDLLLDSIKELTSRFGINLGSGPTALSAREMEVCNLIKSGMSSKEIADFLKISQRTVDTFRNRIRKKLGVANKDVNLFAHLQTLT